MRTLLATTMLSSMLAFPALAQMSWDDMSCPDFVAMDSSGQMEAMGSMASGMVSDSMEAMKSDDATKSGDAMKFDDAMASGEMAPTAEDVAMAGADHPDMMVHDAVEQAKMAH